MYNAPPQEVWLPFHAPTRFNLMLGTSIPDESKKSFRKRINSSISPRMLGFSHKEAVRDFLKLAKLRPNRPDVETLGKLMRSFMRFPYENLTKIIRSHEEEDPIKRLRHPEIILGDHIDFGAGGTCFSLTYFFKQVLEHCGYKCTPVLCDRSYGPDTHCALISKIDGERYLVDPGYLLEHPLKIPVKGSSSISTPFNQVNLNRLGDTSQYLLTTDQGGKSTIRYRLKDSEVDERLFFDRWIDSFNWAQMRHICVTLLSQDGHVYMRDSHLRHSTVEKKSQEKIKHGYEKVMKNTFGIDSKIVANARSCLNLPLHKGV